MKRARVLLAVALAMLAACTKKETPSPAPAPSAPPVATDARAIAERSCLSCHTMMMLEQQRLTEAQWTKVVTKMAAWGANLEPSEQPALVAWLSARFGPDAGAFPVQTRPERDLTITLEPAPDGPYANGDAEHGHALYTDRCAGCHGPDARGQIGVNLVDRPFLYRAADVAATIRKGRGKMPAATIADAEVADLLAYLRTLR